MSVAELVEIIGPAGLAVLLDGMVDGFVGERVPRVDINGQNVSVVIFTPEAWQATANELNA